MANKTWLTDRPWIKSLIFIAVLILAFVVCLNEFWGLILAIVIALMIILALVLLAGRYNWAFTALGYLGLTLSAVGNNNNYRLYVLGTVSIISFICGILYGGGEPIFISAYRDTAELSSQYFDDDRQIWKNQMLSGQARTNEELRKEKEHIKKVKTQIELENEYSPRARNGETPEVYNQKIRNHLVYGTFIDDEMIKEWLKTMPVDFNTKSVPKKSTKTWFFWKLGFLFLFMTVTYLPWAFSDEAARWLDRLLDEAKKIRDEHRIKVTSPSQPAKPAPASGTAPAAPATALTRSGLFRRLLATELSAEFTVWLLSNFLKLFKR